MPYYIAKCLGGTLNYIYCQNLGNTDIPSSHRDASLIKSSFKNDFRSMLKYIVEDAKNIDVVFMWGSSLKHMMVIRMYKMLNPHGKVVIFGDMEFPQAQVLNQTDFMCPSGIKGVVKRHFSHKHCIDIGTPTKIGKGFYIGHGICIVINYKTIIGNNVNVSQFVNIGSSDGTYATIGDNVFIGPHVSIVGRVHIGNNVTIGAGSVVTKDIPDNATVVGVPAKVINYDNPGRYIGNKA